jgi:hypothetical protein
MRLVQHSFSWEELFRLAQVFWSSSWVTRFLSSFSRASGVSGLASARLCSHFMASAQPMKPLGAQNHLRLLQVLLSSLTKLLYGPKAYGLLAFFLLSMGLLCFIYLICSIRTNIILVFVFACLVMGLGFLSGAYWQLANGNIAAAGKLQVVSTTLALTIHINNSFR